MQLKQIARDALLKPLQAVSGIVERRHTLPILANVLLEQKDGKLHVTATDLEMQITAVSELEGKDGQATTVGARKLQDLLRALPDDAKLNVDATGSKMTVRAGRSRFNLQTLAAADYPRISVGQEQLQTHVAAAARFPRAAEARRVRDGAAGHPLLPERHAAGHRPGHRCRRSPPTAIACRGRASRSPATTRARK